MRHRCVVIDDERPARERVKRLLADHSDFELAGEAADAHAAVRLLDEAAPDLCFLDVQMPEGTGFDVLQRARHVPHVIFITAFDRYAVSAFEVRSLDYLLKPVGRERFAQALERARERLGDPGAARRRLLDDLDELRQSLAGKPAAGDPGAGGPGGRGPEAGGPEAGALRAVAPEAGAGTSRAVAPEFRAGAPRAVALEAAAGAPRPERVSVRHGSRILLLDPDDVIWFEADDTLVFARTADGRFLVDRTLSELERQFERQFFRAHRSCLVNLGRIAEIRPLEAGAHAIVCPGAGTVPLSRRQARRLREIFPW